MASERSPDDHRRRDLNGRPVEVSRRERWAQRLRGRRPSDAALSAVDDHLVVVAESVDDAAASSSVLDDSGWRPDEEVVVRHALALPAARIADAVALAALDGYVRVPTAPAPTGAVIPTGTDVEVLVVARVQALDAMHLSQERSRMASLAARHGGDIVGWQVLQSATAGE